MQQPDTSGKLVMHSGSCHCRAVEFQFQAPAVVTAWDCNCSVCIMKKNVHTIIPARRFHLLKGADNLTVYQFGTMTAVHKFCRICGVQSFYHPRSNPDGIAVTIACIAPGTLQSVKVVAFDGAENYDAAHTASGIAAESGQGQEPDT